MEEWLTNNTGATYEAQFHDFRGVFFYDYAYVIRERQPTTIHLNQLILDDFILAANDANSESERSHILSSCVVFFAAKICHELGHIFNGQNPITRAGFKYYSHSTMTKVAPQKLYNSRKFKDFGNLVEVIAFGGVFHIESFLNNDTRRVALKLFATEHVENESGFNIAVEYINKFASFSHGSDEEVLKNNLDSPYDSN